MRTVIIDGDILIYKIPDDALNCVTVQSDETENAIYRIIEVGSKKRIEKYLINKIKQIAERTKSAKAVVCLSSISNFRKKLLPEYKGNRKTIKPLQYEYVRNFLHENYMCFEREGLEADDLIGIIATHYGRLKNIPEGERVIWSMDKDFKTIPGTFYKEKADGSLKKYVISYNEADYNMLYQTLIGDSTDGYCGCPNIGDKKARKILGEIDNFEMNSAWQNVVSAYEKQGLTEDEALVQARCARILRAEDYDFKTKEIKLWQKTHL